jgi:hypothetical protein
LKVETSVPVRRRMYMSGFRFLAAMMTVLMLTVCYCHSEEHSQLSPGVGCGAFLIGKSRRANVISQARDENYYAKKGLSFSFGSNDLLDTLVATSRTFTSDKGIRPGDPEEEVEKRYGKGTVGQYELHKGTTAIGAIGEKTLAYPGIQFVIAKGKVWAIVIVPKT